MSVLITELQLQLLKALSNRPEREAFCLSGGTALAVFYLKHRKSRDLDLFASVEDIIIPFSFAFEKVLQDSGLKVERKRSFPSFVEMIVSSRLESTVVQLALDSPFRLEPPIEPAEFPGLRVDSLADLSANKTLALFGRAVLRDFIDVYFLVHSGVKKEELIRKAQAKDPGFDLYWFAVALGQAETFSAGDPELSMLVKPCSLDALKNFMKDWQKEISEELRRLAQGS